MGPANVLLSDEARARENSFQSQHDFLLKEETERSAKNEKMSTNTARLERAPLHDRHWHSPLPAHGQ